MKLVRSALLTFASVIAFYGAWAVFAPASASAYSASCCNYGQDCAGTDECYYPGPNEAPCSPDQPNYCRAAAIQ